MKFRPSVAFALAAILVALALSLPVGAASPAADLEPIELVGHLGGSVRALSVQGTYAYLGMGLELAIVDISDPTAPERVGYALPPTWISDVQAVGAYAYVAAGSKGLKIVDVSDPTNPVTVGSVNRQADRLAVRVDVHTGRTYAYVVESSYWWRNLRVFDVTDPAAPVQVGICEISAYEVRDVAVAAGATWDQVYVYLTGAQQGLWTVDVSNPAVPVEADFLGTLGSSRAVAVAWPYAYLADGDGGLRVIDVSNPQFLLQVGVYDTPDFARTVAVRGNYAYVGCDGASLRVVDISNPAAPFETGSYQVTESINALAVAVGSLPGAIRAYVGGRAGLEVVDVSDPAAPVAAGAYDPVPYPERVVAVSDLPGQAHAYVLSGGALHVVDVLDPAVPAVVGSYAPPGSAADVAVVRSDPPGYTYAYVAAGDGGGLRVVDVSDPAAPAEIGSLDTLTAQEVTVAADDLAVSPYVYVLAEGKLHIVDVSNPAAPVVVGSYDTPGSAIRVAVAASDSPGKVYAYVVDSGSASYLRVVDVSDPANPVQAGSCQLPGDRVRDLAVAGSHAYVAVQVMLYSYLSIVDISDPGAPVVVGGDGGPGPAEIVTVAGQCVYYAGLSSFHPHIANYGLEVADISNPISPVQIGYYDLWSEWYADLAVEAGDIYFAGGRDGLSILRFTDLSLDGWVSQVNGLPFPGVEVLLEAGPTASTDAEGAYSFEGLYSGDYRIVPSLPGYTFLPSSRDVILPPNAIGQSFLILPLPVSTTLTPGVAANLTYMDTQGLQTTLEFAADAVTEPATIVLTPTLTSQLGVAFAGHAFDLAAYRGGVLQPDLAFDAPVSVTIQYSDWDVQLVTDEMGLALWWKQDSAWEDATQTCDPATAYSRDVAGNALGVPVCRVGRFALFGPTRQMYLPVVYKLWQ